MNYTLEFKKYCNKSENSGLDPEDISVIFDSIPEPITADDMLDYVIRFMLACGYMRGSIIDAMDAIAMDEISQGKKEGE